MKSFPKKEKMPTAKNRKQTRTPLGSYIHPMYFWFIVSSFNTTSNLTSNMTMSEGTQKLVLALNAGSSSLKASVIRDQVTVVSFLAERLTTPEASIHIRHGDSKKTITPDDNRGFHHSQALSRIIDYLGSEGLLEDLIAVGHRVVHGGAVFSDSCLVTDENLQQIKSVSHLAPL